MLRRLPRFPAIQLAGVSYFSGAAAPDKLLVDGAAHEVRAAISACEFPRWLEQELSSDHAGETGAVWIYVGADAAVRARRALTRLCRQGAAATRTARRHRL